MQMMGTCHSNSTIWTVWFSSW